jgi:hypothetical protein
VRGCGFESCQHHKKEEDMSDELEKVEQPEEEKQEFHVRIERINCGYVRVYARNKNEARKATESMSKKKLLGYYKHRFDFVKIGEVVEAVEIIND